MNPYRLTYLLVEYDESTFDLRDFCNRLSLNFDELQRFCADGTMELGRNELFDLDINVMLRRTLKNLLGNEDILLALKEKYALTYTLERVPLLQAAENAPHQRLFLDEDILRFMYLCKVKDDLDYHVL